MNEIISEPKVPREISKAVFIIVPRTVEILGRIKVITFLNNRPGGSISGKLAMLLIEVFSFFIWHSLGAKSVNATSARRQLETICFLRLNVFSRSGGVKNKLHLLLVVRSFCSAYLFHPTIPRQSPRLHFPPLHSDALSFYF